MRPSLMKIEDVLHSLAKMTTSTLKTTLNSPNPSLEPSAWQQLGDSKWHGNVSIPCYIYVYTCGMHLGMLLLDKSGLCYCLCHCFRITADFWYLQSKLVAITNPNFASVNLKKKKMNKLEASHVEGKAGWMLLKLSTSICRIITGRDSSVSGKL